MTRNVHTEILDNLTTAVVLVNAELCIDYLNPAAESLFALSGQRLQGEPLQNLLQTPDDQSALQQAISSRRAFTKREVALQVANGQLRHVDYTVTPILNQETLRGLLVELTSVDYMLRINRDQGLLASQQGSQALIRGLAHEIKNPLGGLRGAAQLLARQLPSEALKEYTDVIIDEADRLVSLVDQLLGPHTLPEKTAVNVHEITERVRQLLIAEAGGQMQFRCDYDPSLPDIIVDKSQLIQAVLNIARNAMQALDGQNEPRPVIVFRTRAVRQFTIGTTLHRLVCRIDITDNGPGITDDVQQVMFMPMVSGRAEGTGLGLAIAQSVIRHHGGIIECDSEPGRTTFSLNLPMESSQ